MKRKTFKELFMFCFTAFVLYVVKIPLMVFLTDFINLHYVFSGAFAGAVLTLIQFLPVKWWIFGRKKNDENK